jgi:hypothetical protein
MYVGMGLTKNQHGVWVVRHKMPERLREAVGRVLNKGSERPTWLQKTTGTKDQSEAETAGASTCELFSFFEPHEVHLNHERC